MTEKQDSDKKNHDKDMKENLLHNLMQYQKKLLKIIKAEHRLSQQYPTNENRLLKQYEARYKTMSDINNVAHLLIDMGEKVSIDIKKKKHKQK